MSALNLNHLKKGQQAQIIEICEKNLTAPSPLPQGELERRLLEMGFLEGSSIELIHEAPFGRDPIVVLVRSCYLVALRKKEASAIVVNLLQDPI